MVAPSQVSTSGPILTKISRCRRSPERQSPSPQPPYQSDSMERPCILPHSLSTLFLVFDHQSHPLIGICDKFNWHVERPDVQYKYGYHVLFPNIIVSMDEHKKFIYFLINKFKEYQKSNKLIEKSILFQEIMEHNTWEELIDLSIFHPQQLEIRYFCPIPPSFILVLQLPTLSQASTSCTKSCGSVVSFSSPFDQNHESAVCVALNFYARTHQVASTAFFQF